MSRILLIGSGINSLCAAAVLAKAGHDVQVFERNSWLGGCIRTRHFDCTDYVHEQFSSFHPLFTTGPAYQELKEDLERHGLEYLRVPYSTATILPDGRAAVLASDRASNIELLREVHPEDGPALKKVMEQFDKRADLVFGLLGKELWSFSGAKLAAKGWWQMGVDGLIDFMGEALPSARKWLDNTFEDELTKALLAPWVLHTGLGPDDQASALMLRVILASFEQTGMPAPKGGGTQLVHALQAIIEENGGKCHTKQTVTRIATEGKRVSGIYLGDRLVEGDAVLANVSPTALYHELLPDEVVPAEQKEYASDYRYGRADMQIYLSLSKQPDWPDKRLNEAPMIHLTDGLNGVSRSVNEAIRGLLPSRGTVVVAQHCVVDPGRAPEGGWLLWIQLQEMPSKPIGDAAGIIDCQGEYSQEVAEAYVERIIDRLQEHLPNIRDLIVEQHYMSPADLERHNPNLVGGDPYCGAASLDQFLFWRPLPSPRGHETPIKNLYHIGAATHPGPGLNGTSGYLVAKSIG